MIIGGGFSEKNKRFLETVANLSGHDLKKRIPVKQINIVMELNRTGIKNILEYLDKLGYLKIKTIGGPLLYGHVSITQEGLEKAAD
jgi:Mn-dependent DtxR family transcriptional regulator